MLPGARAAIVSVVPADAVSLDRVGIGVADFRDGSVRVILQGTRAIYAPTGHIVYARPNGVLHAVQFDPSTLSLAGSEVALADTVALLGPALGDFSLSGGGALVYNKGVYQSYQAVWVDRDGQSTPVAPDLFDNIVDTPVLSPDGRDLVIALAGTDGKLNLWRKPLDGAAKTRLTFDGATNWRQAWRPGGRSIAFSSDRGGAGFQLFDLDVGRPGSVNRTPIGEPRPVSGLAWSPDGTWLLFRTDDQAAGGADILGIRPGVDSTPRSLVATAAEELSPVVSPDGRWMAYSSNESGRREIYVRPFPDTDTGLYQVSTGGGIAPRWNPRGGELFYVDGQERMISVPLGAGPGFQVGPQRVLFDASRYQQNPYAPPYDVTADGRRFVMIRGEAGTAANVVVVFGFLEELKRIMAGR